MTDRKEARRLAERAHELAQQKLQKDEITLEDIVEVQDALKRALDHPESSLGVTITCEGAKNRLEHQKYPDGDYNHPPRLSKREALQSVVSAEHVSVKT